MTATTVADPALLERRISADRLAPYKIAAGGDLTDALDLYQWNAGDLSSEACATIADARRHASANGRAETAVSQIPPQH